MITMPKLACGVKTLLRHAIAQHRKTYQGTYPKCIELHPQLEPMMHIEAGPGSYLCNPRLHDGFMFEGVDVRYTRDAVEPRLVAADDSIEYL
jgi:hypothetical protein